MLICPNCNEILAQNNRQFSCVNNHSFDISKFSHINLLISNKKGEDFGDNKEMVTARTNFLNQDFYKPLADFLAKKISQLQNITLLDSGCGQGYYTKIISNSLENSQIYATDISKHAVIHGAKNDKNSTYFVSSVFNLPIKSSSIDVITSIFAPLALDEFSRVLALDGKVFVVVAGENHLIELKNAIYNEAYKNDENKYIFDNFKILNKEKLTYNVNIKENTDIKHLFSMTPYAFKTSIEDTKKLDTLSNLDLTLDFAIYTLVK